jgi:predicted dehydrogenase
LSPIRWGLLGTARINRLIIPAIRASARSAVHAVASRDAARGQAYAGTWNIPNVCASYDALLASDIDIVYVSLPNSLHVPWTLRAIGAGRHVLCEKPLALTPGDARRVAGAAAAARVVVFDGFMYRHHAQSPRIAEVIASGAIGTLRMLAGGFTYVQNREHDVRLDPALGGGALWDIGCYPVHFGQWLAGAKAVSVVATADIGTSGVDERVAGVVTYANGATLNFFAGFRAAYDTHMHIVGTEGTLDVPRPYRPDIDSHIVLRRGDEIQRIDTAGNAPFVDEVRDIEDAVLGMKPPPVALEESRTLAATIVAIHESAGTGTARHVVD